MTLLVDYDRERSRLRDPLAFVVRDKGTGELLAAFASPRDARTWARLKESGLAPSTPGPLEPRSILD